MSDAQDDTDLRTAWAILASDIRDALDGDPAAPRARALVERWTRLLGALMGASVEPAFLEHYQTRQWSPQMAAFAEKAVWDFMRRALAERR